MKRWYLFYADQDYSKLQQAVEEIVSGRRTHFEQISTINTPLNLQQAVEESNYPYVFSFVPWGHHILIISKCKSVDEAFFYVGDRKLQKNPPIDVLTKKQKSNVPYAYNYVYDDHEPIVSADVWDAVQERLQRIKGQKDKGLYMRCTNHFLYGKVFCAECGEPYRRYTARGKDGLYKTWRCRGHVAGKCDSPHIRETELVDSVLQQLQMEGCSADIYEWAIMESDDRALVGGNGVRVEEYGAISIGNLQPSSSSLSVAAV